MKKLKEIMENYKVHHVLLPKINELLYKNELTKEEQDLLDEMVDTFMAFEYTKPYLC